MSSQAGIGAYERMVPAWETYFAIVTAAVLVSVLVAGDPALPRRLVAAGALIGIALVHAFFGHALMGRSFGSHRAILVCAVQTILFTVAVASSGVSAFMLFALLPMMFMVLETRPAYLFVIAINLVPVVIALLTEQDRIGVLTDQGSTAVVSTAFSLWYGFWVTRVIEQSAGRGQLIAELEASRAEVARLSHEAGVSAERARLAGEIHDTLAQGFTSIITLLQAADPELRDERLALAVRTAKENLAESRALVAELSPSALASASLPDAVRRQATRFTAESAIPVAVRVSGEVRELPTATEVVLLRSAQEALTNVRRHSGAREATILLAYAENAVRLVVRDDGHGFDPEGQAGQGPTPGGGFGLRGMRARAEQVAGALRIRSDCETGTTIELEVPA